MSSTPGCWMPPASMVGGDRRTQQPARAPQVQAAGGRSSGRSIAILSFMASSEVGTNADRRHDWNGCREKRIATCLDELGLDFAVRQSGDETDRDCTIDGLALSTDDRRLAGRVADRLRQTVDQSCGSLIGDAEGERGCPERITRAATAALRDRRLRLVGVEALGVNLAMLANEGGQAVGGAWCPKLIASRRGGRIVRAWRAHDPLGECRRPGSAGHRVDRRRHRPGRRG